jgi:hypothetical protein
MSFKAQLRVKMIIFTILLLVTRYADLNFSSFINLLASVDQCFIGSDMLGFIEDLTNISLCTCFLQNITKRREGGGRGALPSFCLKRWVRAALPKTTIAVE